MALRLNARGAARRSTVRSTRALLSFAVVAGLTVPATAAVAAPADSSGSSEQSAEAYLADLVGEVSSSEGEVTSLELELGGLRESVNKARVDLDRSQSAAQEAQDKVTDARSRLDDSQTDVDDAQSDLDDIARSAYSQGGDAAPVVLASGSDAAADSMDRATYIRLAAEKQQAEVDRLDLARTQAANEESSLRSHRDDADDLVASAKEAHTAAQDAYSSATEKISEKSAELTRMKDQLSEAKSRLDAAKKAVDKVSSNAAASSFDKRRAAEAAAARVDTKTEEITPAGPVEAQDAPDSVDTPVDEAPVETDPEVPAGDPGQAEGLEGAELAEDPEGSEGAEGSLGSGEGEDGATEEFPEEPVDEPGPDDEQVPEDPALEGPEAEEPVADIPGSFEGSVEGDARRQAAIDGLVNAAGAAAFAGISSHLEGNPDGATQAAVDAARASAADSYGNLPEETAPDDGVAVDPVPEGTDEAEGGDPVEPDASGPASEQIERVIDRGMSQLGVTYAWGGGDANGPTQGVTDGGVADAHGDYAKTGFDCSGLMVYSFAAVGVDLPKFSGYQYTAGTQVPVGDAQRGDMLFWGVGGASHVALYLGDGTMLEAPQSGDVVKVSDVRWDGIEPMAVRMLE